MRFIAMIFSILLPLTSQASEGIDINKLKSGSIIEITKTYPNTKSDKLVFVDIDVEAKSKELLKSYILLSFIDKESLHSDEYSEYSYDRYIVSFNIVSGKLEKVVKGGWGSYQSVDNNIIK
ncbi:hypothetical protein [Ferrimonas sp. SCSIO 43195]|uniref:hypothetical protein n=1 Tax=Ferrimonas sp. SCSIO 43195 TaxID=2822844 RepID=UPI002076523F|nr:hypothetical protein [Ferrimonas sp. SCSIO 43195]USD39590.1 hypothetical protein J8Z22_11135 [Ferrimonas sp. SCSIO 43195]